MEKEDICVYIENATQFKKAREILERNKEKVCNSLFFLSYSNDLKYLNYLKFDKVYNAWHLGVKWGEQIHLSELESVLKGEYESKKQSSIEWLIENYFGSLENCTPEFRKKIQQAKQMHREEIEQAYNQGYRCAEIDLCHDAKNEKDISDYSNASIYYNETFKND